MFSAIILLMYQFFSETSNVAIRDDNSRIITGIVLRLSPQWAIRQFACIEHGIFISARHPKEHSKRDLECQLRTSLIVP